MASRKSARKSPRTHHRKKPVAIALALGARIKTLRIAAGFSFDAFVGESELGRGYVSQLERGLVVPTLTTLSRVALTLDLTLCELVAMDSTPVERFANAVRHLRKADRERLARAAERLAAKRLHSEP